MLQSLRKKLIYGIEKLETYRMSLSHLITWILLVGLYRSANAQDQNSFSDATSKTAWTLAYWTTSSNPQTCVPKYNPGWQVLSVISVPGAAIFGTSLAVISVSESLKIVHIHFRGPESMTTFIISGFQYLLQANYPVLPFEGLSVAQEFAQTFTAQWQGGLREAINSAWNDYCDFPIWITGHSVGSCLAQMFAVKMKKYGMWDSPQINLYSYSSPRCGYQPFALAVNDAAQTRYQIRYNEYVPQLPSTTCTSINAAAPQNCFWHAGYGIQYNKNILGITSSSIARCASAEDATCLAGTILTINNHNGFYSLTYGLTQPSC